MHQRMAFDEFIDLLEKEELSLRNAGSFGGTNRLQDLIYRLEDSHERRFLDRVKVHIGMSNKSIREDVASILNPYFDSFSSNSELLHDLSTHTGGYFSFQKAYQLSHARGVWRHRIDRIDALSDDIKHYFLSRMFIDYYETLVMVLRPIRLMHWQAKHPEKQVEEFKELPSQQYKYFAESLGAKVLDKLQVHKQVSRIRNLISHSKVLFKEHDIYIWDMKSPAHAAGPQIDLPLSIYPYMEMMMNLLVVYMTEIDLRLLRIALDRNESEFASWMEYFSNYVHWFVKNYRDNF